MRDFDPPADAANISASFIEFSRTVGVHQEYEAGRLEDFVESLGLSDDARSCLEALPEERQKSLMSSFRPSDECADVSAELISLAKEEKFMHEWGLRDEILRWLRGLEPDLKEEAMTTFETNP